MTSKQKLYQTKYYHKDISKTYNNIGHIPVIVNMAVIGSKDGVKLSTIFRL